MYKYICLNIYTYFLKLLESKNEDNWMVWVLTHWNLEPPAYTSIEGNMSKGKGAPKNNVFFEKGLNRYAYIYISLFLQKSGAEMEHKKMFGGKNIALRAPTGVLGATWNPIDNWATHKMWGNGWK